MLNISFLIKPSEADTKGYCTIYCRFNVSGTPKKEISAGIKVLPENWDSEAEDKIKSPKGTSKIEKDNIKSQNETLRILSNKIRQVYNKLLDKGKNVTANLIKQEYLGKTKQKTLEDAFDIILKNYPFESASYEKVKRIKDTTSIFILDTYRVENIYFSELEEYVSFGQDWENYVRGQNRRGLVWKNTYAQKMFAYVKRAIELAKKMKWIESNPIEHSIKTKKSDVDKKEFLTLEEVVKIKDFQFANEGTQRAADIFIFQCCTGLAYIDVKNLTYEHIKKNLAGSYYFHHPRQKSDTEFTIPLIPMALSLIEKYKKDEHRAIFHKGFCFPVKSNGSMNDYLKHIATLCNINKDLTTHCARYTCNQLLYEAGVSDEIRKQILGHSAVSMTAEYTTRSSKLMNEAMIKLGI